MLAWARGGVNKSQRKGTHMAKVTLTDGIVRIIDLEVHDPRAAAVLAEYPEAQWPEITRRALKIGLGVLRGGGREAGH